MNEIIKNLWIVNKNGIVLFNYSPTHPTHKMGNLRLGALLNAMDEFAEEFTDKGLQNFELDNEKYLLFNKEDILYIANSSKNIDGKDIINKLKTISEKFLEQYKRYLDDWKGNVDQFSDFEDIIKEELKSL
ncbi:MAG: hypothetical protein ACOC44_11330 [Promethearchaeia archaeon]